MSIETDRQAHWQGVWHAKEPNTVSWFQPDPAMSLEMIGPAGPSLIDVGGGASLVVDRLLERGFTDLAVLDIAEAALARAKARLGGQAARIRWIASDLLAWQPDRIWDIWHDRAVLHFMTSPEQKRAYRDRLRAALAPDGTAIIAAFAPDGPEKCSGLPVARHDGASLVSLLGDGFTLAEERTEEHRTPGGSIQRFCWCRFKRR